MDVMKNKKVAYCVDFVTVHHCTKFRSHLCNTGDFTEGGTLCPPIIQGFKKPGINRVKILAIFVLISYKPVSYKKKRVARLLIYNVAKSD